MAGLVIPGNVFKICVPKDMIVPVFPALTHAWALPDATDSITLAIDESRLFLSAMVGFSESSTFAAHKTNSTLDLIFGHEQTVEKNSHASCDPTRRISISEYSVKNAITALTVTSGP
jgi:hypothetical protein